MVSCKSIKNLKRSIEEDLSALLFDFCTAKPVSLKKIQLTKPIMNGNKVICVGMNYQFIYPLNVDPPPVGKIIILARYEDSLVNPNQNLNIPLGEGVTTFDYEGEIVVVIGNHTFRTSEREAWDHVLRYSLMNKGSVPAWQTHSILAGKNSFMLGSWGP
ncbi:MAG: 2-keto-4-pentenoate hydratase/2-oxohepta-3-ene-1,7-dioic acid hydratase in catechol pathway [Paracoccaceae bacterium]|jgi:2-keto-4-pentenoate hydratase/2-oxohepta-3-ene-1,7-dioic acid hydratase in catechol pathway